MRTKDNSSELVKGETINLYDEISKILGFYVNAQNIDKKMTELDSSGVLTQKKFFQIVMLVVKYVGSIQF